MRTRFEIEAQGHSEIEFLIILILVVVNPKYNINIGLTPKVTPVSHKRFWRLSIR